MGKSRSAAAAAAAQAKGISAPVFNSQKTTAQSNLSSSMRGQGLGGGKALRLAKAVGSTRSTLMNVCTALVFACVAITAQLYLQKNHPESAVARALAPYFGKISVDPSATTTTQIEAAPKAEGTVATANAAAAAAAAAATELADANAPKGANSAGKPREVDAKKCEDRHQQCVGFAAQGECDNNPGWMIVNCPHSCDSCELLDPQVRCNRASLGIKEDHVYKPGDMQAMFSAIEKTYPQYGVTVHSTDPWVVTFDNFLSDDEVNALITSVDGNWERSTDTGSVNEFGETGRVLSQGRTSNNAWCRKECYENHHVQNAMKKIEDHNTLVGHPFKGE